MTLHVDIYDALRAHLVTPALTSPAPAVAYPLVAFTPAPGTPYLQIHSVMRAEPEAPFLDFDSDIVHRGIFQVDAVVPDGGGEAPGLRLAELVAARFVRGTTLDAGEHRLKILRPPAIAAAIKDAPWVRFPVSIAYFVSAG